MQVAWQDGTVESGVRTIDLVPVKHMGAHDFFPEEYVLDKIDEDVMPPMDVDSLNTAPKNVNFDMDSVSAISRVIAVKGGGSSGGEGGAVGEGQLGEGGRGLARDLADAGARGEGTEVGGDGGGEGGAEKGGAETLSEDVLNLKLPDHLIPVLNRARMQLREELVAHLSTADATRLDELVAHGNLGDTLAFVTTHPQAHFFLQRMMRLPQWQELMRDGAVHELANELFNKSGIPMGRAGRRHRFGILKEIDCDERICKVEWLGICGSDGSREVVGEEARKESLATLGTPGEVLLGSAEVSCYELLEHPEYTYSIGDVVVRLQQV